MYILSSAKDKMLGLVSCYHRRMEKQHGQHVMKNRVFIIYLTSCESLFKSLRCRSFVKLTTSSSSKAPPLFPFPSSSHMIYLHHIYSHEFCSALSWQCHLIKPFSPAHRNTPLILSTCLPQHSSVLLLHFILPWHSQPIKKNSGWVL